MQAILDLWENHRATFFEISLEIIASVVVVIVGILISRGLSGLIKKASRGKLYVDDTISSILRHITNYGIFVICVIMILNIFGVNTTSLLAVLGAAGIAVGLALKDTLGNIASGIILFFLGSYRLGEFIEFGSFSGTVKEINLFTTILETPDGIFISAPNSSIWGNPVRNYSRNGKRRMELTLRISYSDSLDAAFRILNETIDAETRFLKEPAPQIIVQSLEDSSVNLVIRAWAENRHYWDIYWEKMRVLKEKAEDSGLHIPFPQRDVHVIQSVPVS
jgi:small conductance mechanosensitive channel